MKKLIALFLALAMLLGILPAMAEGAIDTSEHVKIVYLVTGDKPTTGPMKCSRRSTSC